jgi:DNA repair protein RadA/Sms
MPKVRRLFVCRQCGASQARWLGKCPDCNTWDSLEETSFDPSTEKDPHKSLTLAWQDLADPGASEGGGAQQTRLADASSAGVAKPLADILRDGAGAAPIERIPTGIRELDRTLGISLAPDGTPLTSGLVPGSAVLVGGEPGIGKSTLLLQAAFAWANQGTKVLYVSSEESAEQVGVRAKRVGGGQSAIVRKSDSAKVKGAAPEPSPLSHSGTLAPSHSSSLLYLLHDTNLARIVEQVRKVQPRILVIDSVQMIYRADVSAAPGSVTQLRRCCTELVYLAKTAGIAVVLVGHVTKDGTLAGPRLLEHLVDTVLSFEGDRSHSHRVVRAIKNRFGSTLEIGLFEMGGSGLREVAEGGVVGALANQDTPRAGCVLVPIMTGTRCLIVEVQALTATGFLGAAKRKCSGLDANRLAMLIAVLEQHAGLRLADRDIFASSVGGIKVLDPASDLALLLAISGAHYRKALPPRCAVMGEVGLSGEVRAIPNLEQRVREAVRLGCKTIVIPKAHDARDLPVDVTKAQGVEVVRVKSVDDAIGVLG